MTSFVRLFCVAFAAIASTSSFAQIVPLPPIPPIPKSAFPSAMCGVDLRGIDIMPMPGRPEQCPLFCFTIDRCDGVTWTNHRGGTCWLKTVFQFAFIGMTVPKAGAISFVLLPGPFSVPVTSLVGVDFPGNDLTNRPTKSDAVCGSLCLANTDCYAWTWTNYNGGTCWLKRKATDPVPKAGAKSGYLIRTSKDGLVSHSCQ